MKKYLVGKGMVGLLRSFMYCQSTLILLHKTADRSSIYWSQCSCIFILCYTHLKLALLLQKTVLVNIGTTVCNNSVSITNSEGLTSIYPSSTTMYCCNTKPSTVSSSRHVPHWKFLPETLSLAYSCKNCLQEECIIFKRLYLAITAGDFELTFGIEWSRLGES